MAPIAFLTIFYWLSLSQGSGISEALIGYLLISLALSFPVAILLGLCLATLFTQPKAMWTLVGWGMVIGAGLGALHFLAFPPRFGFGQPSVGDFIALCLLESAIGGLTLPWFLRATTKGAIDRSTQFVSGGIALTTLSVSAFFAPNVAFRLHRPGQPMDALARTGAERALRGEGPLLEEAQKALALDGNAEMQRRLIEQVAKGKVEPGPGGNLDVISGNAVPQGPARTAMLEALEQKLQGWSAGSTSGERDYAIESLIAALGPSGDPRATALFMEAYQASGSYLNVKLAAAKALAGSSDPEAAKMCAEIIRGLHPNLDLELMRAFRGSTDPRVRAALADFDRRRTKFLETQEVKRTPLQQLAERGEFGALLQRALDPNGSGQMEATSILIRAHRPEAIKAFMANIRFFSFRGKEFRGFDDAPFVAMLEQQAAGAPGEQPVLIARFLGDWSPSEAAEFLRKAMNKYNLREAARGLGRIGGVASAKALLQKLDSLSPLERSFAMTLVAALADARQPIAVPALTKLLHQPNEGPSLASDGNNLYLSDAAALALQRIGTPEALAAAKTHSPKGSAKALADFFNH